MNMTKKSILICLLLTVSLSVAAEDRNMTPSPDSTMVAFTRGNDLWVRCLADSSETRLTSDGTELILNGYASWVYYEEIFGRASDYRAFWWSPDSRSIAYYRFDNTEVPVFPIFSPFGQNGSLSMTRYPKAGQTNPSVRVGIVSLGSGETTWARFDYSEDQYFGTPFWSPDSRELFVPREPRRQNTLELFAVNASDGGLCEVYREEYPTWVEWIDDMLFTDDGFYMARDFETGWEQIYFLGYDGSLRRLTEGENWDIRLLRTDGKGHVWFTAKRDSRLRPALYLLDRRGKVTALTDPEYTVAAVEFSEDGRSFTAQLSNARTPVMSIRGRSDRFDCEKISDPDETADGLPVPEVVKIENDGFDLYALMSLPENFDPSRRYPVVMQLYGGPGTPYVRDRWRDRDASDDWCYRNDVIYIVCDPRSSGENGREGMDQAFRQMTVIELGDYVAWAEWLRSLPYVDGSRIGVKGFSFGGTTTAMLVLRYPQYFRCGIAGYRPVGHIQINVIRVFSGVADTFRKPKIETYSRQYSPAFEFKYLTSVSRNIILLFATEKQMRLVIDTCRTAGNGKVESVVSCRAWADDRYRSSHRTPVPVRRPDHPFKRRGSACLFRCIRIHSKARRKEFRQHDHVRSGRDTAGKKPCKDIVQSRRICLRVFPDRRKLH